jgi:ACS family hexuronate transporter-like MFS transporter
MPAAVPNLTLPTRPNAWKWWVCGLLLLATTVNYMDRVTINVLGPYIRKDLGFTVEHYGYLESAFAIAFALSSLLLGFVVDRWNVYWVYPAAVLAWSAAGFATGFAGGFATLLACRFLLGLAEGANWPCALRTTQRILPPAERAMGNGLLQSGAALGAFLTPLVVLVLFDERVLSTWRYTFWAVGGCGALWVIAWWSVLRRQDLALPSATTGAPEAFRDPPRPALPTSLIVRRFAALIVLVVAINLSWHFFRAWLPLFLHEHHHYSADDIFVFTACYYVATDLGSLSAGFLTLRLARRGLSVHRSRLLAYVGFALLTTLSIVASVLPRGPLLLGVLLVVGFGALGVFPNYYSFSQDLTTRHQGKVTGTLGCCCWLAMAALHAIVGRWVERTGSYAEGVALAGLAPLAGILIFVALWGKTPAVPATEPTAELSEPEALAKMAITTDVASPPTGVTPPAGVSLPTQ